MVFFYDWVWKRVNNVAKEKGAHNHEAPILKSFCSNCFPFGNINEGCIEVLY